MRKEDSNNYSLNNIFYVRLFTTFFLLYNKVEKESPIKLSYQISIL